MIPTRLKMSQKAGTMAGMKMTMKGLRQDSILGLFAALCG
jgi:hypothetical protein